MAIFFPIPFDHFDIWFPIKIKSEQHAVPFWVCPNDEGKNRMGNLMERLKCAAHLLFPYTCKFFVYCSTNCAHIMCAYACATHVLPKKEFTKSRCYHQTIANSLCLLVGWLTCSRDTNSGKSRSLKNDSISLFFLSSEALTYSSCTLA